MRVGYNLFEEVRFLLTVGQPSANAGVPTLEEHISLLRDWITLAGIPLVEIPPVPSGYNFIACLTHDIDHPALRNHWCDHTMFGFLYRSTIGTWLNVCKRQEADRQFVEELESGLPASVRASWSRKGFLERIRPLPGNGNGARLDVLCDSPRQLPGTYA